MRCELSQPTDITMLEHNRGGGWFGGCWLGSGCYHFCTGDGSVVGGFGGLDCVCCSDAHEGEGGDECCCDASHVVSDLRRLMDIYNPHPRRKVWGLLRRPIGANEPRPTLVDQVCRLLFCAPLRMEYGEHDRCRLPLSVTGTR